MIPTPEMIEAAHTAWKDTFIRGGSSETATESALTAALALLPREPIGWVWKLPDGDEWQYRDGSEKPDSLGLPKATAARVILQPVFATPAPLPVAVKAETPYCSWNDEDKLTAQEAWTILCETPDITSPEEYPDHALITMEQLGSFMARSALSSPAQNGYCTDCENQTTIINGRCSCGSGRVVPTPASDIAALREAGERLLKACDAYDSDELHTDDSVCAYSDALEDFRSALQHVAKGERG